MPVRYLITGGAGFIGSHLAERLLAQGHQVAVIDDLSTGAAANLQHLKSRPGFSFTYGTVRETAPLGELVDTADTIFHLAAAVGVRLVVESPVRTIETNVHGTELVLALAAKKKKRVLVASTSEVYGKSSRVPFGEDDDLVLGPSTKGRWSYACSKALDEFLAIAYWREKKLPATIVRLFNTVGPRQTGRYGMVIPRFVDQALAGEPIQVFGDGQQTRCFAHVHDVVWALARLSRESAAVGQIFNVGNDREITIDDLARRVVAATASGSEIVHVPYDEAYTEGFEDMRRRVPDISKIGRLIGYSPRHGIDEILADVIADARARAAA